MIGYIARAARCVRRPPPCWCWAPPRAAGAREKGEAKAAEKAPEKATVLGAQDVATAEMTQLTAGVVLTGCLEPYRTGGGQGAGARHGRGLSRGPRQRRARRAGAGPHRGAGDPEPGGRRPRGVAAAQAQLSLARNGSWSAPARCTRRARWRAGLSRRRRRVRRPRRPSWRRRGPRGRRRRAGRPHRRHRAVRRAGERAHGRTRARR